MPRNEHQPVENPLRRREPNGLGALCAESQADGVPCPGQDCRCEECARAYAPAEPVRRETRSVHA